MKLVSKTWIAGFAVLALSHLSAQISYAPGYGGQITYTHSTADSIVSFDWDSGGTLTYMTSAGWPDVKVWRATGGTPTNVYSSSANFAGASVVSIGDYVYFNDSTSGGTQNVNRLDPNTETTSVVSTTPNFGLYGSNGDLFITGSVGFGTNHIYHSDLDAGGNLVSDPATDLGVTFGGSGPLAFDAAGNMYYAPGFSDTSIYKWTASQVADAIADPVNNPLPTSGVLWYNYSADYAVTGATGMAIDAEGDLYISLTDFINPSHLVKFDVDGAGDYAGNQSLLSSTARLGDVRSQDGSIVFGQGNQLITVIPEPAGWMLAGLALSACLLPRLRKRI